MYKEKFDLSGKVAILTGGSGLIGAAFGEGLAECGCNVVICDIEQKSCDNRAKFLEKEFGVECIGVAADVSNKVDVERLLAEVLKRFGKVDI